VDCSHVKVHRCANGLTKGGRNRKLHAIVDASCRPWAFILTPGNTADCVMAEECVSLLPGIKEPIADKGYDTDAIRAFLTEQGIRAVISGKSNRKRKFATTRNPTKSATSSNAVFGGSRTDVASQLVTTSSRNTSFPRSASSLPWPIGSDMS
jgi:transposase